MSVQEHRLTRRAAVGPPRRRPPTWVIAVALAVAASLVGLLVRVVLPRATDGGRARLVADAPLLVVRLDSPGSVEVSAPGELFLGVARAADLDRFLDGRHWAEADQPGGGRVAEHLPAAADGPAVDGGEVAQGAPGDPRDSDIWVVRAAGTDTAAVDWPAGPGDWRLVVAGTGDAVLPPVDLTWTGGSDGAAGRAVGRSGEREEAAADPVVSDAQAVRISQDVDAARRAAADKRTVQAAGGRLVGPAREMLAARLRVALARGDTPSRPPPLVPARLMRPRAGEWPRWFAAAGTETGQATPVLRVLRSGAVDEPYGVWAELSVLPGATLPEPAAPGTDAPSDDALAMTPQTVAVLYADVLNRGRRSEHWNAFAPDDFRLQLGERLAADRKQIVSTAVADLTSVHSPVEDAGTVLPTGDGGALVVVELRQTYTVTITGAATGGGAVRADPDLAALAGQEVFGSKLVRQAVEVLAFAVPPAPPGGAAGDRAVHLVAAVKGDVSATGS